MNARAEGALEALAWTRLQTKDKKLQREITAAIDDLLTAVASDFRIRTKYW